MSALDLRAKDRKKISKALQRMVHRGDLKTAGKGRFSLARPDGIVTGEIRMSRRGTGFVVADDEGSDIMVPRRQLGSSLPGDRVIAQLDAHTRHRDDNRRSGKIVGIVERADVDVVGTLRTDGKTTYVAPVDRRYSKHFIVRDTKDAAIGDRVVARLKDWAEGSPAPLAEIIDVIGPSDVPSLDTIAILRHYGIPSEFPAEVVREAEMAARRMDHPGRRRDLRDEFILTIDPERARDFDDALSLSHDKEGRRVLGVHIADVSHFIRQGSAMDEEAVRRGNSVYLPDKVVPMLPEQLSNGICSLKPDTDRLAFSAFITVDAQGNPISTDFARTRIRSKARLTYEEALGILDPGAPRAKRNKGLGAEVRALVNDLAALAQQLRRRRFSRFALNIDLPECEISLDRTGRIREVRTLENDPSHQLVEECMVSANEAVDKELSDRGLALIHRTHEPPDPGRLEELASDLRSLGFSPGRLVERRHLARFLEDIESDPLAYHLHTLVLRSMRRAEYSTTPAGHYGLAKQYYAHFTSPIRRYADLVVHRILAAALRREPHPYTPRQLASLAVSCTSREEVADGAERELTEIKKYRFLAQQLEDHKAEVYDAVVVSTIRSGAIVELIELQIEGIVPVDMHSRGMVHHDRRRHILKVGRRSFTLGQLLQVRIVRVEIDERRIEFAVVESGKREGGQSKARSSGTAPGGRTRGAGGKRRGSAKPGERSGRRGSSPGHKSLRSRKS